MKIKSEKDFIDDVKKLRFDVAYLLIGEDDGRKKRTLDLIRKKISSDFDIIYHSSDEPSMEFLISDLLTPPLFATKRFVILDKFEKIKSQYKKGIFSYLSNPLSSTVVFLLYNKEFKNYEIEQEFGKIDITIVNFPKLEEEEIEKRIVEIFTDNGKKIEPLAVKYIAQAIVNYNHLENEVEKILLFLGEKKEFTYTDALNLVVSLKERNIWKLADCIMLRDKKGFLDVFDELLKQNEEPLFILSVMVIAIEKILKIKLMYKKFSSPPYELLKMLGITKYDISKYRANLLDNIREENLIKAIEMCLDVENTIKSTTLSNNYLLLRNLAYFISANLMTS